MAITNRKNSNDDANWLPAKPSHQKATRDNDKEHDRLKADPNLLQKPKPK